VHQLEVLLLLERYSDREWKASEIARELYTDPSAVAGEIEHLRKLGMVKILADDVQPSRVKFQPADEELATLAKELAGAYKMYRLRVIDAIFATPDPLKEFSDAFKFRKEEDI
jgi:DNA-binding MarR family transcriptional regulator